MSPGRCASPRLLLLAAAALAGCTQAYDHLELQANDPGAGAQLASRPIVVPEGVIASVTVTPMSSDGPLGGDFSFDLVSSNTDVLGVEPVLGKPPGPAQFVFFGAGPGEATIVVTVNGQTEAPIPATVTPQP
jgi:hypothetical protein